MVEKTPIPSDRLLANETFGCSERRLMALAGVVASFSVRVQRASHVRPGFGAATRHALEECMRAFVGQAGNVSKVRLHIDTEKQEPV